MLSTLTLARTFPAIAIPLGCAQQVLHCHRSDDLVLIGHSSVHVQRALHWHLGVGLFCLHRCGSLELVHIDLTLVSALDDMSVLLLGWCQVGLRRHDQIGQWPSLLHVLTLSTRLRRLPSLRHVVHLPRCGAGAGDLLWRCRRATCCRCGWLLQSQLRHVLWWQPPSVLATHFAC